MSTAVFLSTACAFVFALAAFMAASFAFDQAVKLRGAIGRIASSEQEIAIAFAQIHKLRQKIYSQKHDEKTIEIANSADACENWAFAQTEGPTSKAAACACAYCSAKRLERDDLRARLVPKRAEGRK